jgi:hypothetical protein
VGRVESVGEKERQEPVQFNSVKVIKEPGSPLSHSRKRGGSSSQARYSHKNGNNRKPSQLVSAFQLETIISDFCSK